MCSINGFVSKRASVGDLWILRKIILAAEERGRDSFGIAGPGWIVRKVGKPSDHWDAFDQMERAQVVISNNRAEPTTEYVEEKEDKDIQPFVDGEVIVAHNGTIANDKELKAKYALRTSSEIDSAVIPPLIRKLGVVDALNELVGSYALAIFDNSRMYLACNYKPIFVKRTKDTIFFSSLEAYLRTSWWDNIVQLPPYSITSIDPDTLQVVTLPFSENKREKVLVICSGGLDSVTVATKYVTEGKDVTLLHFLYGCRAEKREIEAIKKAADYLNCAYGFIDAGSIFRDKIGGSRLTNTYDDLMTDRGGEASAELAYEWVPARNLVFYSLALAYAEAHNFDIIALGNNLEESGAYPDNEMIFTQIFSKIIPYSVNLNGNIIVEQPVGNLMKHEIVRLGLDIGAPLHLTWSCYEDREKHCGTCGPCYMRKKAFKMVGVPEVVEYET